MMNVLKKITALNFASIQPCWNTGLDDKYSYCRSGVRLMESGVVVAEFVDFGHNTEVNELFSHVFKDNGDGNVTIRTNGDVLETLFQRDKIGLNEMIDSVYSNDMEYFGRVTARLVNARELKYYLAKGKTWEQAVEKIKSSTDNKNQLENLEFLEELINHLNVLRSKTIAAMTAAHEKHHAPVPVPAPTPVTTSYAANPGDDDFVEVKED